MVKIEHSLGTLTATAVADLSCVRFLYQSSDALGPLSLTTL